jgi:hypothetical protein
MSDIYYDNDGNLPTHPLESLNLIDKASEKQTRYIPPSVYENIIHSHSLGGSSTLISSKLKINQKLELLLSSTGKLIT